jgi:uncharacterized membrane protein
MNWDVITKLSPPEIQLHWATATVAFLLGIVIFANRKGTRYHKSIGSFYAALMLITAISAFFIRRGDVSGLEFLTLKGMTWIHLFVPLTLYGITAGLYGILVLKNPKRHRGPLIGSYIGGLIIAGAFTFLPERRMHMLFFEDPETIQRWIEMYPG